MVGMAKQPEAEQSNRDYRRRPDGICQNRGRIAEEIEQEEIAEKKEEKGMDRQTRAEKWEQKAGRKRRKRKMRQTA